MLLTFLDTETTGLKQEKGHRIVEYCGITVDFTDNKVKPVGLLHTLINPRRLIPDNVVAIHGITNDMVKGSPYWEDVAPKIVHQCGTSDLLIAHNMDFDASFLGLEFLRVGQPVPETRTFCTMREGRWATGTGKNPKLEELCWAVGVDYSHDKSHRADYDVKVMIQAFFKGMNKGHFTLPVE